jgi:hypothetical protein
MVPEDFPDVPFMAEQVEAPPTQRARLAAGRADHAAALLTL